MMGVRTERTTRPAREMPPEETGREAVGRLWRLQFGPCWCQGLPGETGSFDFVRTYTSNVSLDSLGFNVLILSDRVIDGFRPVFLQLHERVPEPRLVLATAACPQAAPFWNDLPVGWSPVGDLVTVDVRVDECVNGRPETLVAAVLDYATSHMTPIVACSSHDTNCGGIRAETISTGQWRTFGQSGHRGAQQERPTDLITPDLSGERNQASVDRAPVPDHDGEGGTFPQDPEEGLPGRQDLREPGNNSGHI